MVAARPCRLSGEDVRSDDGQAGAAAARRGLYLSPIAAQSDWYLAVQMSDSL